MFAKAKSKLNEMDFARGLYGQASNDPRSPSSVQYGGELDQSPQVLGSVTLEFASRMV